MASRFRRAIAVAGMALVLSTSCSSGSRRASSPTTTALPAVGPPAAVDRSPGGTASRFLGAVERSDRELARSVFDVRMLLWSEYPLAMMGSAYAVEAGVHGDPEAQIERVLVDPEARGQVVNDWLGANESWLRSARCHPSGPAETHRAAPRTTGGGAFDRWLQSVEAVAFVPLSCETPRGFPAVEVTVEQEISGLVLVRYRDEPGFRIAGLLTDNSFGVGMVMMELGSQMPAPRAAESGGSEELSTPSFGIPECDAYAARACNCSDETLRTQLCRTARIGMQGWQAAHAASPDARATILEACAASESGLRTICTQ